MDITLQEIADIIDDSRGRNYFSNHLEKSLAPLFKKLYKIENSKEEVSIMNLFGLDDIKSAKFKKSYEDALKAFIKGFNDKVKEFKSMNIMDVITGSATNTPKTPTPPALPLPKTSGSGSSQKSIESLLRSITKKKFDTEESDDRLMEVSLVNIEDNVLDRLGSAKSAVVNSVAVSSGGGNNDSGGKSGGSLLGKILKTVMLGGLAAGLMAGGIAIALKGLVDGGPTKGLLKLVGNTLLKIGTTMFEGFIKNVKSIFKPVVGLFKVGVSKMSVMSGRGIFKSIGKIFSPLFNVLKTAGKGAKFVFKSIPYLGSLISLAFAYTRFKDGDTVGGILELTSALLGAADLLFPALGRGLAFIPDAILMFRDFKMTPAEKQNQGKGFFDGMKKWFLKNRFVKSLVNVFSGIGLIFGAQTSGDIDRGIDMLLKDDSLMMVLIPWISPLVDLIVYFKDGQFMEDVGGVVSGIQKYWGKWSNFINDIFDNVWNYFAEKIKLIMGSDYVKLMYEKIDLTILTVKRELGGAINIILEALQYLPKKVMELGEAATGWMPDWSLSKIAFNAFKSKADEAFGVQIDTNSLDQQIKNQSARVKRMEVENQKKKLDREAEYKAKENAEVVKELKELKGVVTQSAAAQVNATTQSGGQIVQSILKRDNKGNAVTNIFTDNLSKQNEDVRRKVFEANYGL